MMRRTWLQRLPLWAAALAPLLRPTGSHAQGSAQVWLRIRNSSQEAFTHVWQGLPQQGTDVDLGPLLPGDTSRWHALPATLAHYRKTRIQIGQRQLSVDGRNIVERVDFTIYVDDVFVFKAAHHMRDGIGLADVGKELVTQAFAFTRARNQTGNIHEFHAGRDDFFGFDDGGQCG